MSLGGAKRKPGKLGIKNPSKHKRDPSKILFQFWSMRTGCASTKSCHIYLRWHYCFLSRLGGTLLLAIYHLSPNDFSKVWSNWCLPPQVGNPEPSTFLLCFYLSDHDHYYPLEAFRKLCPKAHARMGSYQVLRHGMVWCAMHVINSVRMLCSLQSCLLPSSSIPVAYKYRDAHCISMVLQGGMVSNWPISMICQASRCSWYRPAPRPKTTNSRKVPICGRIATAVGSNHVKPAIG